MTTALQKCLKSLMIEEDLRTWSLIVTVFGDLARKRNHTISGTTLNSILKPIGVNPTSVRVAVHRLRNEGWLVSSQKGRTSFHKLSQYGLTECEAASKLIYSPELEFDEHWHVAIGTSQQQTDSSLNEYPYTGLDHITVSPGVYIGNGKAPYNPNGYVVMDGSLPSVPDWLKGRIGTDELCNSYRRLYLSVNEAKRHIGESVRFSPIEVAALRTVLVHNWRRLVLKHPALPECFFPDDWHGQDCRTTVISLLDKLKHPDLALLSNEN